MRGIKGETLGKERGRRGGRQVKMKNKSENTDVTRKGRKRGDKIKRWREEEKQVKGNGPDLGHLI